MLVHEAQADEGPQLSRPPYRVPVRDGELRPPSQHSLREEKTEGNATWGL